ncbi:3'-5' exonuclease [Streptomyces sp. Je 1-79]|uniref:3'-5' exonuclease n=1 Tax=Streptomyces sp. Je 1-79 TaxID=2943847 RepID=UPI0021A33CAD|nr:3'-5' exonuclease [Streptomyces sp. Je 1-79]MCT4353521.1 3'-5' exonuclease [Streptomyces sp. Je 1-79]
MNPGAPDLTNDYDGPCAVCGAVVPAGAGVLRHGHGPKDGWEVFHPEHVPEPAPPARQELPGWHRRRLMAVDIVTTGYRAAVDRILAASVRVGDGTSGDWIMDPGSNLRYPTHGTRLGAVERARAEGAPAPRALDDLATVLADHLASNEVLVVWFAPHVLTTLHAELLRHGLPTLAERLPHGVAPVCDPLVLDRHADRYRPGSRSLRAVTAWYGVPHDRPGDAASDAEASLALAQVIADSYPALAKLSRPALHTEQILWYAEQMRRHPDALEWPFTAAEPLPWEDPPPAPGSAAPQ